MGMVCSLYFFLFIVERLTGAKNIVESKNTFKLHNVRLTIKPVLESFALPQVAL
jgi:hypothetical protein